MENHTDSKHYSYGSHHWIIPDWLPGMYRLVTAYVFKVAIPSLLVLPTHDESSRWGCWNHHDNNHNNHYITRMPISLKKKQTSCGKTNKITPHNFWCSIPFWWDWGWFCLLGLPHPSNNSHHTSRGFPACAVCLASSCVHHRWDQGSRGPGVHGSRGPGLGWTVPAEPGYSYPKRQEHRTKTMMN